MTNKDTPTAEQLVRDYIEYIKSGLWKDVYGTGEDFKTICESYLSLLEKNQWWESHMGNTIPEEYRQWGCDSAKMMSEEIAELKAQLKIAKDALEAIAEARVILKEPELDKMKADLFEYGALQPIKDVAQDALSKLTI